MSPEKSRDNGIIINLDSIPHEECDSMIVVVSCFDCIAEHKKLVAER